VPIHDRDKVEFPNESNERNEKMKLMEKTREGRTVDLYVTTQTQMSGTARLKFFRLFQGFTKLDQKRIETERKDYASSYHGGTPYVITMKTTKTCKNNANRLPKSGPHDKSSNNRNRGRIANKQYTDLWTRKQSFIKDFVWQALLKDYNLLGFDAV
jgi:hypothetical protein